MYESKGWDPGVSSARLVITLIVLTVLCGIITSPVIFGQQGEAIPEKETLTAWYSINLSAPAMDGAVIKERDRFGMITYLNLVRIYTMRTSYVYILNFDTKKFWLSKYRDKTFAEGSFDELKSLLDEQRKEKARELEKQAKGLVGLPSDMSKVRRNYIENERKKLVFADAEIEASPMTSPGDKIANVDTKQFNIRLDGKKLGEVWIAQGIEKPDLWDELIDLMVEFDPIVWKPVKATMGIPLRIRLNYAGANIEWECTRFDTRVPAITNFMLPETFDKVPPSL